MNDKEKLFIEQIEEILEIYNNNQDLQTGGAKSLKTDKLAINLITRINALVERITGTNSEYYKQIDRISFKTKFKYAIRRLTQSIGVIQGLYQDLKAGNLKTFSELIHADIFSEYIDMAKYLLEEGYKDPAAVITGSTLEEHLRKLCKKNGIDIKRTADGKQKPKKVGDLNSDLVKGNVYSKLEQKSVTAWLGLRNNAAHGNYNEYNDNQVKQMIMGVRDFIIRNPA